MSNALLGSRISLISKKNIRYEGVLYSINESDATVALQNVRSFGTEGREKGEPTAADGTPAAFVPPSDTQHPYLLFRGCDIKDLHVHEEAKEPPKEPQKPPEDPAILSAEVPEEVKRQQEAAAEEEAAKKKTEEKKEPNKRGTRGGSKRGGGGGGGSGGGGSRAAIGTGQNLMNRKERGVVDGAGKSNVICIVWRWFCVSCM